MEEGRQRKRKSASRLTLKTEPNFAEKRQLSERLLLMINVRRVELKLPHCLTRRARGCCLPACLPGGTLLCVWLPWLSSVCFVTPPPSLPPSLSPSPALSSLAPLHAPCRPLWMWWWTSSSTTSKNSGRRFGVQHRHLVTAALLFPTGQSADQRPSICVV